MLQIQFIGTLGADAEKKVATESGSKFTTFRAAHNDVWKDDAGEEHTRTIWVDCILNDHPNVADYLKQGTQVFVSGYPTLRVYSSPKDRCMKAGLTINVQRIELLGGRVDLVPRELVDENAQLHRVNKYYNIEGVEKECVMQDKRGNLYNVDKHGWVAPVTKQEENG